MNHHSPSHQHRLLAGFVLSAACIGLSVGAYATRSVQKPVPTSSSNQAFDAAMSSMSGMSMSGTSMPPATMGSLKDGSYKASGSYFSPGGKEDVQVSVTLSGGVVTAADVVSGAHDPTASSYQASFISGYKSSVVGKKLTAIKLKNVAGSSLTSQGFNDALKQIAKQASA